MDDKEKYKLLEELAPEYWRRFGEALAQDVANNLVDWKELPFGYTFTDYPHTKEDFLALRRYLGHLSLVKWGNSLFADAIDLRPAASVEDQYDKWTMSESKRKIMKGLTK